MSQNFMWTHDTMINLIELFREKTLLWDTSCEDYKFRHKKYEAWQEIADTLGLERHMVEKKMRMLTGQYKRELVKEGGGVSSKWFAFQRLRFLGNAQYASQSSQNNSVNEQSHQEPIYIDTRSEGSNMEDTSSFEIHEELLQKRPRLIHDLRLKRHVVHARPQQEFIDTRSDGSNMDDSYDAHEDLSPKKPRLIKRHEANTKENTSDLVALFREEKRSRDEFTVFGEHIAHKLRKITNPKAKATTQYLINQILYNAEMGKYDKTDDRNRATSSTGCVVNLTETDPVAVDNPESVVLKLESETWE